VSSNRALLKALEVGDNSCSGKLKGWWESQAALTGGQTLASLAAALFLCPLYDTWHTSQEQAWFETWGGNFLPNRWWKFTDGRIAILESLAPTFFEQFHEGTHSGQIALETTLAQHFYVPKLSSIGKTVCEKYSLCARNNPWYLLVFVYTFSGWIKPSPLGLRGDLKKIGDLTLRKQI
jgi:hypothetical protein